RRSPRVPPPAASPPRAVQDLCPLAALRPRLATTRVTSPPALTTGASPVLGVVGESSWPRSRTFMQERDSAVPRMQLVAVAESSDPTPLCRPDVFNEILAAFLSGRPVAARPGITVG